MVSDSECLAQLKNSTPRLLNLLAGFSQVEVLVVGDLTLDEFTVSYTHLRAHETS